jgi:hypothetical protein
VGVVHRNPDLERAQAVAADLEDVGEVDRVTDLPVLVVLGLALTQPALDDAVVDNVEPDSDLDQWVAAGGLVAASGEGVLAVARRR